MSARYIRQHEAWPNFTWDSKRIGSILSEIYFLRGRLSGLLENLGFELKSITALESMSEDVIKSSEIEGVLLSEERVRSSIARHLGIATQGLPEPDHLTEAIVQIMIDATQNVMEPLSSERLFNWHAALFPTGRSGMYPITVAEYRKGTEPMQVVSGALGKEKVHYEAPPSNEVPRMMGNFLDWCNLRADIEPTIKAGIAHLWFVCIHPFDDGNGRLARTITDMLLGRADKLPYRFYSMSGEILRQRKAYYEILEETSTGTLDITPWLEWFLETLCNAMHRSEETIKQITRKSLFWQEHRDISMSERQIKVVNKLWDGFTGKLTSSKWAKICKTSQATALRDINDLVDKGILIRSETGSRSISYTLSENRTPPTPWSSGSSSPNN